MRWLKVDRDGNSVPKGQYREGQAVVACSCQTASRIASRIPKHFAEATLASLPAAIVMAFAQFIEMNLPGLLLTGLTGRGKSYAAAAFTKMLIEAGQDAHFFEVSKIFRDLRSCINSDIDESAVLQGYIAAPWVVLDDLGAGAQSDFERRTIVEILNGRNVAGKRTIVTTNLSIDEIRERVDERVSSRLAQFLSTEIKGKDRRAA